MFKAFASCIGDSQKQTIALYWRYDLWFKRWQRHQKGQIYMPPL